MNIREAILAAASHIERNPGEFYFASCVVPDGPGCGSPGCAIGWIACFMGDAFPRQDRSWVYELNPLGVKDRVFYDRMTEFVGTWTESAKCCAVGLRLYADKYHPATERPIVYPNWQAIASAPLASQTAAPAGEVRS